MSRLRYSVTLFREFLGFAHAHRAYWIVPMIIVLSLMGLVIVTSQAGAPLIYALF